MDRLKDKNIVIGVTGSIAAYKIATLCSSLKKRGANITVIMTKNALNFVNPITYETLTGTKCLVDTFDRNFQFNVEHVSLAKLADVFLIAPASADVIAKAAHGIADDMLTTTLLACDCPKFVAPAMNTRMYKNPITQDNIKTLVKYGFEIINPANGYLACGDTGDGKMAEPEELMERIEDALTVKDLQGKKVLVTAGPTQEKIDPVRYITNHSSGKMGYAIATEARRRGAEVTLVSGVVSLKAPYGVNYVPVVSAEDMANAVISRSNEQDIIIMAAAVADYKPSVTYDEKVKKTDDDMSIALSRTQDILGTVGQNKKEGLYLCGFAMETENLIENAKAKLKKKNLDMIVANSIKTEGAGFGTDTNIVTLITPDNETQLELMSKSDVANVILDEIIK